MQFSFSHPHLGLTTQERESCSLRGLFLACYSPPSLSRLQPSLAEVSKVSTGLSNNPDRSAQIPPLTRRNFTLSRLLQRGLWLLRRLRPLCCTLAFSRPFRARQCESSSIPSENVVATRSCLLYAERLWSPFSDVHRKMYPPGIGPHLT